MPITYGRLGKKRALSQNGIKSSPGDTSVDAVSPVLKKSTPVAPTQSSGASSSRHNRTNSIPTTSTTPVNLERRKKSAISSSSNRVAPLSPVQDVRHTTPQLPKQISPAKPAVTRSRASDLPRTPERASSTKRKRTEPKPEESTSDEDPLLLTPTPKKPKRQLQKGARSLLKSTYAYDLHLFHTRKTPNPC